MFKERWYGSIRMAVRLLNVGYNMSVIPMDWRGACIVSLYKGKGDKYECSKSRGISLLSVVGKLYGWVLIKIVRAGLYLVYTLGATHFPQWTGFFFNKKSGFLKSWFL